jgi:hypothetical protein
MGMPPRAGRRSRRLKVSVLGLMVLVVLCGVLLWMVRLINENSDLDRFIVRENVRALRSNDVEQRLSAARDLGRFGSALREITMPALIAALADADADVRGAAAGGLGQVVVDPIDARAAARALNQSLKDSHPTVRIASADALATLASVKRAGGRPPLDAGMALAALIELLGDRNAEVRSAALKALALVGPEAGGPPPGPSSQSWTIHPKRTARPPSPRSLASSRASILSCRQSCEPWKTGTSHPRSVRFGFVSGRAAGHHRGSHPDSGERPR